MRNAALRSRGRYPTPKVRAPVNQWCAARSGPVDAEDVAGVALVVRSTARLSWVNASADGVGAAGVDGGVARRGDDGHAALAAEVQESPEQPAGGWVRGEGVNVVDHDQVQRPAGVRARVRRVQPMSGLLSGHSRQAARSTRACRRLRACALVRGRGRAAGQLTGVHGDGGAFGVRRSLARMVRSSW
jgi:hypothetical protein